MLVDCKKVGSPSEAKSGGKEGFSVDQSMFSIIEESGTDCLRDSVSSWINRCSKEPTVRLFVKCSSSVRER